MPENPGWLSAVLHLRSKFCNVLRTAADAEPHCFSRDALPAAALALLGAEHAGRCTHLHARTCNGVSLQNFRWALLKPI